MKKSKNKKIRNIIAIAAKKRATAGSHGNKKDKRKNGKNKQKEYMDENY